MSRLEKPSHKKAHAIKNPNEIHATAEEWCRAGIELYRPMMESVKGVTLAEYHISMGFTNGGTRRTRTGGQTWGPSASTDKLHHIFLNPRLPDPMTILRVSVHEAIHVAAGLVHGHKGLFVTIAKACGMDKKWTATPWTKAGEETAKKLMEKLGQYPRARFKGAFALQTTRLLKVYCAKPIKVFDKEGNEIDAECGYTMRIARGWIIKAIPKCPIHPSQRMEIPGGMFDEDEDEDGDE